MQIQRKVKNVRPLCQRKKGNKGEKPQRGKGEGGKEKKRPFNSSLQPGSINNLEKVADYLEISRSEVIDQASQGEIDLLAILKLLNLVLKQHRSFTDNTFS